MRGFRIFLVLILIMTYGYGCKQRVITQPEAEQQIQPQEEITQPQEVIIEQKVTTVESVESKDIQTTNYVETKEAIFKDVLFDFDRYTIKESYKPVLRAASSWLMENPGVKLSIEGHCDDRGTNEYNLALGDRRAKAVRDYLVSLGVPSSKIDILSYGEERPLCMEKTEDCRARNRRAHFVILSKGE